MGVWVFVCLCVRACCVYVVCESYLRTLSMRVRAFVKIRGWPGDKRLHGSICKYMQWTARDYTPSLSTRARVVCKYLVLYNITYTQSRRSIAISKLIERFRPGHQNVYAFMCLKISPRVRVLYIRPCV